jgi:ribosomal protein L11 methyltransferase
VGAAERVLGALVELAPGGFEQVDGEGFVEYALYGAPGEVPALPAGEAEVAGVRVWVSATEVATDWADRWKQFHKPVVIGERVRVRPPWSEPHPGTLDLVIDPGRAFGTGAHPTTRLCLELLLELEPHGSLLDLGCGSGVLAIAAAKLGFDPVHAVDNELAALDATRANARTNGVELDRVERLNLRDHPPPPAGVVVANLTRPLLLRVAELMTARPDSLIVSGLLDTEADEVAAAFDPLSERRRLYSQGWCALRLDG